MAASTIWPAMPELRPSLRTASRSSLAKSGEIADPHAADRLAVLVADQMGGGEIVAVELLLERAVLFAHVDGAADRDHARHLVHRSHHLAPITGVRWLAFFTGGRSSRAIEHLQMRREQPVIARARREAERFQHPQAFLGDRPRIDVDAAGKAASRISAAPAESGDDRCPWHESPRHRYRPAAPIAARRSADPASWYRACHRSGGACLHDSAAAPRESLRPSARRYRSGRAWRSPRRYRDYG